jgi:hypothetical protein
MKMFRYFLRGIGEIARELGILKSVVRPRKLKPPSGGRTEEVLRYVKAKHSLKGLALFDPQGVLVASTIPEEEVRTIFSHLYTSLEELGGKYVLLRDRRYWNALYKRRKFFILVISPYVPEIVDLWIVGREIERFLWGSQWED